MGRRIVFLIADNVLILRRIKSKGITHYNYMVAYLIQLIQKRIKKHLGNGEIDEWPFLKTTFKSSIGDNCALN